MAKSKQRAQENSKLVQLCVYVKPENARFARINGREEFGSHSAFVDNLIDKRRAKSETRDQVPNQ